MRVVEIYGQRTHWEKPEKAFGWIIVEYGYNIETQSILEEMWKVTHLSLCSVVLVDKWLIEVLEPAIDSSR